MYNKNKTNDEGVKKMAVSKATLLCVKGDAGKRLLEDIKLAKINNNLEEDCKVFLEKLRKGEIIKNNGQRD